MLDAIWMICQSCTDSLLLAHVAIHAIATDLGAVVVGSNSPMFHIVHHWYNITQNSPLVKRFFQLFSRHRRARETESQYSKSHTLTRSSGAHATGCFKPHQSLAEILSASKAVIW